MKRVTTVFFIAASMLLLGSNCRAPSGASSLDNKARRSHDSAMNQARDVNNPAHRSLADMLRRVPGLEIRGVGDNIEVFVRGPKTFEGENNPTYVLDGVPLGRNYSDVAPLIDVQNVESIRVIKGAQAARYGAIGSTGVVEIKTKS